MAKTQKIDPAAAKQRKQKIILGVIGGMFLLLAVIQGPKLMKQVTGGSSAPAVAAPADTTAGTPAVTTGSGAPTAAGSAFGGISGQTGPAADPTQGKLISFSLFEAKDPFVPLVKDQPAPTAAATGTPGAAASATGAETPPATNPAAGNPASPAAAPEQAPLTDATLVINGTAEYLKAKGTFPAADPVFELVVLKPKTVKIGVAGGAFSDGKLLVLKMDKAITLVNTATGARYKITLVYTGTEPEQVEGFTAKSATGDASAPAATGSSAGDASAPAATGSSTVDVSTASK
jgi:hypothetical protein